MKTGDERRRNWGESAGSADCAGTGTEGPAASDLEEASVRRHAEDPGCVILLFLREPFRPEMTQLPSGAECHQEDSEG